MADFAPTYCPAGALKTVHAGPGVCSGLVVSHSQGSAQTVILYDGTDVTGTVIARIVVNPGEEPSVILFPNPQVRFASGLTVQPANAEVLVFGLGVR